MRRGIAQAVGPRSKPCIAGKSQPPPLPADRQESILTPALPSAEPPGPQNPTSSADLSPNPPNIQRKTQPFNHAALGAAQRKGCGLRRIARAVETSLKLSPPNGQKGPQQSPISGASQAAVRISKTQSHPRGTTSLSGNVNFGDSLRAAPLPGPPSPSASRTKARSPQGDNSATAAPLTAVDAHHSRHQSTINSASTNTHSQDEKKKSA